MKIQSVRFIFISLTLVLSFSFNAGAVTRYVNASNATPVSPYTNWSNAATSIQDAIDAAVDGDQILVTNGIYATGGKVMGGDLTNRVALDKAIILQSVNGPNETIIQGMWDPAVTNGPLAVRCAWLTNNATLNGFTLRGGATRALTVFLSEQMYGGGVWGASSNATVINCFITNNTAAFSGGGAYRVTLNSCVVAGNTCSREGGGVAGCYLRNCVIAGKGVSINNIYN